MCLIATYRFDCCFFLITFSSLELFVLLCGEWCCRLYFGYCVAPRIRVQFLYMLPYGKRSLISMRKLLGAAKVNVIVHSAFKKLFELSTVYMIVSLRYHKLFNI